MEKNNYLWDVMSNELFKLTGEVTLGRDSDATISYDDESLSGKHCAVASVDTGWGVIDLSSTNGTKLNCKKVLTDGHKVLEPFSVIDIGDQLLVFFDDSITSISDRNEFIAKVEAHVSDPQFLDVIKKKLIFFFKSHHGGLARDAKIIKIDAKIQKGIKLRTEKLSVLDEKIKKVHEELKNIQQQAADKIAKIESEKKKITDQLDPQLDELSEQRESLTGETTASNSKINIQRTGSDS